MRQLLELLGFDVLDAADGRGGLDLLAAHPEIRLVVLDVTMPEMSGEEAFAELRRIRGDVPVVVASGYDPTEAFDRFATDKPAGFLAKPFTVRELADVLRGALVS
jgi:CheY-like chemotaxis protein